MTYSDHLQLLAYALCMWMQEGSSHVSTYTTKDELDSVEGGGGLYGRKNICMCLPPLPRLSGMEGGGDCEPSNTLVTANLCFTRPKEIIWITVD